MSRVDVDLDLTIRDILILSVLARGPRRVKDIAGELGLPASTVHWSLTKLAVKGYVLRNSDKSYGITREGLGLIKRIASTLPSGP